MRSVSRRLTHKAGHSHHHSVHHEGHQSAHNEDHQSVHPDVHQSVYPDVHQSVHPDGDQSVHHANVIRETKKVPEVNAQEGLPDPPKESPYIIGNLDATTLGIIIGCSAAALLIIIIAIIIFKIRRNKKKFDLLFEDSNEDSLFPRSCPTSRRGSPRLPKRLSCPDAYSSMTRSPGDSVLIRSVTIDTVPDFELPPERVQPRSTFERSMSVGGVLHYQQSIGSIQPELYNRSSSFSEDDEGNLPPTEHGRLWFSIIYDVAVEQLCVNLVKVKSIPGRAPNQAPRDPFVKLYLLPDERTCRTSKTRKKSLSPVFNESFTFQVSAGDIFTRTLRFSVYDVDKRQTRHSLGHVMVPLKDVDLTKGDTVWCDLEPMAQAASSLGEVQVSLSYIPQHEKIKIVVLRSKNLRPVDYTSESGLYARVQFYYGRRAHKNKKTTVQRIYSDPEIHESFSFSIAGKQLDNCNIVVSIMTSPTRGPFGRDEEYGRITIGPFMFARGDELLHWQEMISQSKEVITRWHTLTSFVSSDLH